MYLIKEKKKEFQTGEKSVDKTVFRTITSANEYILNWMQLREQEGAPLCYMAKNKHGNCLWIGYYAQRNNGDYDEITLEYVWNGDPV